MMLPTLLAFTGLVTLASTTPVTPAIPQALPQVHPAPIHRRQSSNSTAPCAQVSQVIYSNPDRPSVTTVPAKLAYDCIKSVPFNASSAKRLLHDLPTYINWQSTLATLKNPPAEYAEKVQPPVDILGGLDKISSDIDAGKYKSEYDFGWDLYTLIQSAHDGHFAYIPDSVGEIFGWGRPIPLVSVSEDGSQLPAVFAYSDVLGMQFKNITYTPSAVTKINGADVFQYLETLSQYGSLQDRDALYNNLFYEVAQVSLGTSGTGTGMFSGGGRGRFVYPGPNTTLTFANGSDITVENYARVYTTFRNIQTGEDLAKTFSWGNTGSTGSTELQEPQGQPVAASVAAEAAVTPGYPEPIVPGPGGIINGFYVDVEGYEDVAVLQVPNFVGSSFYEIDFQATTQKFIPRALADGKKKLIIDLQANGGGTILQGYDLFKQLFPSLDPYGANRFRYTEALDLIGQSYSAFASQFPRGTTKNSSIISIQASYFDYHNDMTVDAKPFGSWQEKVGPHEVNGDKFTTLSRWNLSDVYITSSSGGINITGYGPLANVTGPPKFAPENIVLLTDGYCASTCTIFSELMTKQGGVKTIALGGRSNKNKIQAIGGVKGVNNYNYGYLQASAQNAIRIAPPELQSKLNSSVLRDYDSNVVFNRGASVGGVNVRDGLALNDTSGIALQFKYEEADCRLYYTPEMTIDATAIWKAAADAQWGSSGKCVGGGGYGEKRASNVVTTKLSPGRIQVSSAAALQKFEAFEKSFDLETDCQMEAPGFMKP